MKNLIKYIFVIVLFSTFTSCDNSEGDNEGKFDDFPEIGWVQFSTASTDQISIDEDGSMILEIPVEVNVPVSTSPLRISYGLVGVSGENPNDFFNNSGVLVNPANTSSTFGNDFPIIELDISQASGISEIMVFDVVLESTDNSNVKVGISGSPRPTSHRIEICPSLSSSVGTFIGDYMLSVPSGLSLFGVPIFDEQVVALTEGPNGVFSRQFMAPYLPAFSASPETMTFSFSNGQVRIDDAVTSTGCASAIVLSEDSSAILSSPCGDASLTLNMLDFSGGSGGCGVGDVPIQLLLTKI